MYACLHETGRGFFGGCKVGESATYFSRATPTPLRNRIGVPAMGLRSEEDHQPRYRGRGFSLG
jgi:hypothetical protein